MSARCCSSLDDLVVRSLRSADLPNLRELHARLLPVRYPQSFFLQLLVHPSRACLVVYHRSQPANLIAFISAALQTSLSMRNRESYSGSHGPFVPLYADSAPLSPHIEILTLGVLLQYQRRGLARHLIMCVAQKLSDMKPCAQQRTLICANVSTTNMSALMLYKGMGMQVSSTVIANLYRTSTHGSKDAYLVVGYLQSMDLEI